MSPGWSAWALPNAPRSPIRRLGAQERPRHPRGQQLSSYYRTPDADPEPGSDTWIDRLEDARDGGTVREIRGLLGDAHSAPPPQAPKKGSGRFGRKAGASVPKVKVKRGFRRKGSPSDQPPGEHDEVSVG